MDFRSTGIGLNGLHLPHFPPPNHPISPSMIYYNLNPSSSSGCHKNSGQGESIQMQICDSSPKICAIVEPNNTPKKDGIHENGGTSSFATALRNLAINVEMNSTASSFSGHSSSSSSTSSTNSNGGSNVEEVLVRMPIPAQSAFFDVRKGFDRHIRHAGLPIRAPSKKVPTIPSPMTPVPPKTKYHHPGDRGIGTGFQPYRAHHSVCEGSIISPGSHPSQSNSSSSYTIISPTYTFPIRGPPHLPYPVSYESTSLYQPQYETYMPSMATSSPVIPISTPFITTTSNTPKSSTVVSSGESPCNQSKLKSNKELSKKSNRSCNEKYAWDEDGSPSLPKKKCLFVRPFEDNYSSQKKFSIINPSFKEPVLNTTAYHPPSSTYIQLTSPIKQEESTNHQMTIRETNSINPSIKIEETEVKANAKELKTEPETHVIQSEKKSSLNNVTAKISKESVLSDFKQKDIIQSESTQNGSFKKLDKIKSHRSLRNIPSRKKTSTSLLQSNPHTILKSERRMMVTRSPSPPNEYMEKMEIYDASSSPSLPLPSTLPHLNKLPESSAKRMYLQLINLTRVPENKKQEREDIWNAVLDDRMHRNSINTTTKYLIQLRNMNLVKSPKLHMGFLSPNNLSKSNKSSTSRKTHFITTMHNGLNHPKLPIDLGSLVPVSKSLLTEVKKTNTAPPIVVTKQMIQNSNSSPISVNSAILSVGSNTFELKSVTPAWTGIENVIEGYKKHHQERDNEIHGLNHHLNILKQEESKKISQFDTFTSQMANSVRHRNSLKSKKSKLQENIKEFIALMN
nr:uncharacterized protein LOC121130465 [Lepeophtheirus salmonis]